MKFIELTRFEDHKLVLINLENVVAVCPPETGHRHYECIVIDFGNGDWVDVVETYEQIRDIILKGK